MSKNKILEDSSDDNDNESSLKINDRYAANYNKWREKEEIQKLKDRYGDVDLNGDDESGTSSTSESEDDDAREWNDKMEKSFFTTLSLLKSKNEKIYDKEAVIFQQDENAVDNEENKREKKSKPLYLKDLEREMILEKIKKDEVGGDEKADDDEKVVEGEKGYYQEQEEIKKSFKKVKVDGEEEEDFLKVKSKTREEKEKEQSDYIEWLKGQRNTIKDKNTEQNLVYLHDYWNDPSLSDGERYLRDYILNKRYLDNDDDDDDGGRGDDEDGGVNGLAKSKKSELKGDDLASKVDPENVDLSEDEKIIETQETFEKKYNFRFEEPDEEFIKSYPRTIQDSVRRKDNKRKLKREDYKERKEAEKQKKKEEIKRLKNLKRNEIMEKINKIKEITGNNDLDINIDDFDKDFDPKDYDKRMQKMFDSNFYQQDGDDDEKPVFSDSDPELELDYYEDWTADDEENDEAEESKAEKKKKKKKKKKSEEDQVEEEFNMDCDAIENEKKQPRKGKSKFSKALNNEKPVFDPNEKSFEEYFDEYYKLDCEDIIGGDLPCRFKYREVVPNDFGLTVDEILNAPDQELNAWASLKKSIQHRPIQDELRDVRAYKDRSKNIDKKKQILRSLYEEQEEEEGDDAGVGYKQLEEKKLNEKESPKKKDKVISNEKANGKKKKKNKSQENKESNEESPKDNKNEEKQKKKTNLKEKGGIKKNKKKKNNNKNKGDKNKNILTKLSNERLQAYGINPKKFHKKLKYSNDNNPKSSK